MEIICEQLNPHSCKTYLVGLKDSPDIVLIDPVKLRQYCHYCQ